MYIVMCNNPRDYQDCDTNGWRTFYAGSDKEEARRVKEDFESRYHNEYKFHLFMETE